MVKQSIYSISITDLIIYLPGILLFACWLLKTSLGRAALVDSVPRRNNMPFYLPFIPLLVWLAAVSLGVSVARKLWQSVFLDNLILCIGGLIAMAAIILLARRSFTHRLKGFGLDAKTIHKDFFAGVVNLLAVWPLVLLAIVMTIILGQLIRGPHFHLQQHEGLELIAAHQQLPVRIMIIITSIGVVPAFEEMLFRGLFQTMFRSFVGRPWLSILISSGLFAAIHPYPGHWPALFVLAVCLGYSYERSGSLFRPIFIHSFFNATSIILVLYDA